MLYVCVYFYSIDPNVILSGIRTDEQDKKLAELEQILNEMD